jgi:spermidine synthase
MLLTVPKHWERKLIYAEVFITGLAVLVIEVLAVRVLAPHFGTTIYTTSSVISVVLAALSFGYFVGGRLADRYPDTKWFYLIIVASGLSTLIVNVLSPVVLTGSTLLFSHVWGPLFASFILFFIPSMLLGMLSPFAVVLERQFDSDIGVGSVSGNIFFFSTVGSIVGGVLTGFILIPLFGISEIMVGTGIALTLIGLRGATFHSALTPVMLLAVAALGAASPYLFTYDDPRIIYEAENQYAHQRIVQNEHNGRDTLSHLRDNNHSGAMYVDAPNELVFDYSEYAKLAAILEEPPERVLTLGAAATFSIPKYYLNTYEQTQVDVVDIDPTLLSLGREYFHVPETERLNFIVADGRRHLERTEQTYDVIFMDAFTGNLAPPNHMITQSFFEAAKARLSDEGVLIMNVIGPLAQMERSLTFSVAKTFESVFPHTRYYATEGSEQDGIQNIIFAARSTPNGVWHAQHGATIVDSLPGSAVSMERYDVGQYTMLTDNYAPVEYLAGLMLAQYPGD